MTSEKHDAVALDAVVAAEFVEGAGDDKRKTGENQRPRNGFCRLQVGEADSGRIQPIHQILVGGLCRPGDDRSCNLGSDSFYARDLVLGRFHQRRQ